MIFLNSVSSVAALVFYLPTKGKQREARVRNNLKSLEKNTIFNEHPVVVLCKSPYSYSQGHKELQDCSYEVGAEKTTAILEK